MSKYVDVYLMPVKKENVVKYKKLAKSAGKLFRKNGALTYREYISSDLKVDESITGFPKVVKLKDDEVLIYAEVGFNSEAHRNKVMKLLFADPDMSAMAPEEQIFDIKRMVYGGFKILVEI